MCVGASYAGVRSMTATSGSGLCLMAEGITLAGISETPLVVVNGMRPGPAAGMPTWTGQGDLKFVIAIGHDEYPKVVLAPGDAQEAFELTKLALEWAEKWQMPVLILADKYLTENDYSLTPFVANHQHKRFSISDQPSNKDRFKRYQNTEDGVSLRTLPGIINGIHCCNSYEHDEYGWATESAEVRTLMMNKRLKKMLGVAKSLPPPVIFGKPEAKIGIVSWGSNKSPILEALKALNTVKYLHLNCLWPFPETSVTDFIKSVDKVVCIEGNATGQLASLIREQTGIKVASLLKYDGRPFYPEEIIEKLAQFG
jgi:2-oxoglutarate ferredoxin oxidoreductase subunit alpha